MKYFTLLVVVITIVAFSVSSIVEAKDENPLLIDEYDYVEVTVQEGDTIWKIAKQYYAGDRDFRELIFQIEKINEIEQGIIYPGQVILIPIT